MAGTTCGYLSLFDTRYPLMVKLWKQSDNSTITRMQFGSKYEMENGKWKNINDDTNYLLTILFITHSPMETPSVWTTSGNNRIHQWNLLDATCERSLIVKDQKQGETPTVPISLEDIPLNVSGEESEEEVDEEISTKTSQTI